MKNIWFKGELTTQRNKWPLALCQRKVNLFFFVMWALVTYQSITIADSHRGLWHVSYIPSEDTVPIDMFLGLFRKVLLPFHKSPWGHKPPVGPQPEVQFFPKHSDIEKQVLSRCWGDWGHLRGIAGHPFSAAKGWGWISSSSSSSTVTSTSSRDHVRNVPAVGVCAEWHD